MEEVLEAEAEGEGEGAEEVAGEAEGGEEDEVDSLTAIQLTCLSEMIYW
jgi:hypothetical protein